MTDRLDPLRALRAKKNLNRLRNAAKLPGTLAKVRRQSLAATPMTKANLDKIKGRAGFYRSSRAVHAFDSDASITVSRSWGDSHCSPGDFVIVGAPKASTNWHNDVYVSVLVFMKTSQESLEYSFSISQRLQIANEFSPFNDVPTAGQGAPATTNVLIFFLYLTHFF